MGCGESPIDDRVTRALSQAEYTRVYRGIGEIDAIMLNYFWQVMTKRRGVHLHTTVLEFLGYEGQNLIGYASRLRLHLTKKKFDAPCRVPDFAPVDRGFF